MSTSPSRSLFALAALLAFITGLFVTTFTPTVAVPVAARDLPVGTRLNENELPRQIRTKRVAKADVLLGWATSADELAEKRIVRTVRVGEPFNRADLTEGSLIVLPPGMRIASVQMWATDSGWAGVRPGGRVDVLATGRPRDKPTTFPLLGNVAVVAVESYGYGKGSPSTHGGTVAVVVDRMQGFLLRLAESRGCQVSVAAHTPGSGGGFDVEHVLQLLAECCPAPGK